MIFKKRNQKGFALIELMIVLAIMAGATALYMENKKEENLRTQAEEGVGVKLASITTGLRSFIAANNATIIAGAVVNYTDLNFLKTAACGGTGVVNYVPCNMDILFPFYMDTLSINIGQEVAVLGVGSTTVAAAELTLGPWLKTSRFAPDRRIDLTEAAINKASSTNPLVANPTGLATFAEYSYEMNSALATFGEIRSVVSMGNANDIWLRHNGTNSMTGSLDMNGNDMINGGDLGTATVTATGNINSGGTISGVDVTTAAGRSLQHVTIKEDIIAMNAAGNATLDTTGITCDPGTTMKLFGNLVVKGHDNIYNGDIVYATSVGAVFTVSARVHTAAGWVAPKSPAYFQYRLRCMPI